TAAATIVELLDPALHALAARFHPLPPTVGSDDVYQQLVLELLVHARRLAPTTPPARVPLRLLEHASGHIRRWLDKERRLAPDGLADGPVTAAADDTAATALTIAAFSHLRPNDRELLIRHYLHRVPYQQLASTAGCSAAALRQRAHRALAQLR